MSGPEPYLLSLVAFAIGALAGFQGVHGVYQRDAFSAAATCQGVIYLISRGALPAGVFLLLSSQGAFPTDRWFWAMACGAGVEVVLRAQISLKRTQDAQGNVQELSKGPLDLLRWYESLLLDSAGVVISERRKHFILANLPSLEFPKLCQQILNNVHALPQPAIRQEIERAVEQTGTEYAAKLARTPGPQTGSSNIDLQYRLMLGYRILNIVGRRGFRTICCN